MLYGVVAEEAELFRRISASPLGVADFAAGTYQWAGAPIEASDVVDSILISQRGLHIPPNLDKFPQILGSFGQTLKTAYWTLLMDVEFSDASSYAPFIVLLRQNTNELAQIYITFDFGEWEVWEQAWNNDTGQFLGNPFLSDWTHGVTPGVHRIAVTRTDDFLAFSVDGSAADPNSNNAFNIENTDDFVVAGPYTITPPLNTAQFGGDAFSGAASADCWVRSLTLYTPFNGFLPLRLLSKIDFPTDPEAALYGDGGLKGAFVTGGAHIDAGPTLFSGQSGLDVLTGIDPGAVLSADGKLAVAALQTPYLLQTSFGGSGAANHTTVSPLPSTRKNGQVIIALCGVLAGSQTITVDGDWRSGGSVDVGTATIAWFFRVVDGSEKIPTFNWTTSAFCAAEMALFDGADICNPFGAAGAGGATGTGTAVNLPGFTSTQNYSKALAWAFENGFSNVFGSSANGFSFRITTGWSVNFRKALLAKGTDSQNCPINFTVSGTWAGIQLEIVSVNNGYAAATLKGQGGLSVETTLLQQGRAKLPGIGAVAAMPSGVTKTWAVAKLPGAGAIVASPSNNAVPVYKSTTDASGNGGFVLANGLGAVGDAVIFAASPPFNFDHSPLYSAPGWTIDYSTYKLALLRDSGPGSTNIGISWPVVDYGVGAGFMILYGQCGGWGNHRVNFALSGTDAICAAITTKQDDSRVVAIVLGTGAAPAAPAGFNQLFTGNTGGVYAWIGDAHVVAAGSSSPAISSTVPDGIWSAFLVELLSP